MKMKLERQIPGGAKTRDENFSECRASVLRRIFSIKLSRFSSFSSPFVASPLVERLLKGELGGVLLGLGK